MAGTADWRDRAATITRGLAAGVGSRVAFSRITAGRVGQARPERKIHFALAQPGRVCRRIMAAAKKTGGRDVSRPSLWIPDVAEEARFYVDRRADARAGHWREHGDFQRRQRRVAALDAL